MTSDAIVMLILYILKAWGWSRNWLKHVAICLYNITESVVSMVIIKLLQLKQIWYGPMYGFCEDEDDISDFITAGRFRSGE